MLLLLLLASGVLANAEPCKTNAVKTQEMNILDYSKKPPYPVKSTRYQVWGCNQGAWRLVQVVELNAASASPKIKAAPALTPTVHWTHRPTPTGTRTEKTPHPPCLSSKCPEELKRPPK